jgi:tripartite-type tricarboxylate transporter receptor subunit TctC
MAMKRRQLLQHGLASAALLSSSLVARAQSWPERDLRLVLPFSAGGSADIAARMVAAALARQLGRQVIVENRPGAGGLVGSDLVAKSAPDGYTLLVAGNGFITLPLLRPRMPYAEGDLVPVSAINATPSVLLANATGAKTILELQTLGRNRNNLNFGTAGQGSTGHFVAEMLRGSLGVPVTVVHYKSGSEVVTALIGGQIDAASEAAVAAQSYVRSGKLNALAITADTRLKLLPQVPTTAEQGFADIQIQHWGGLFAPRGTPLAVLDRLHAAMQQAMRQDETLRNQLAGGGYEPLLGSRAEFENRLNAERSKLAKIVADSKMSQD